MDCALIAPPGAWCISGLRGMRLSCVFMLKPKRLSQPMTSLQRDFPDWRARSPLAWAGRPSLQETAAAAMAQNKNNRPFRIVACTLMSLGQTVMCWPCHGAHERSSEAWRLVRRRAAARFTGEIQNPAVVETQRKMNALTARHYARQVREDRKSTRLNSSHSSISYSVFFFQKKK